MKLTNILLIAVLLTSLLPGAFAQAQTEPLTLRPETVDSTAFPTVTVRFNAWDGAGLPLGGLDAAAITLQEDGGAPFHPDALTADTQAPLQVALVVDISGSMAGQPLEDARVAAARFLDRLSPDDQAALIAFSSPVLPDELDPVRELDFTKNLTPLYDRLEALGAGGGTALYDATAKAISLFVDQPAGHRAVVLLSDGRNDPPMQGDPEAPIRLAQENRVPVFVIGLGSLIDEPYLRRLASDTGGLYRAAPSSSELAQLFADMATLLKTQYHLSYTSRLPADGEEHTLKITLDVASSQALSEVVMGPLPLAPTAEPTLLPTPVPTAEPTASPTPEPEVVIIQPPEPTPLATALPPEEPSQANQPLLIGLAAAGILLLGVAAWLVQRNKKKPKPEACAKCGYDLTGKSGACPVCGSTRRLPKMN
ncbi:MAG: VWA domain-containing protein [Anaerolineales bacterium]|jgi:VWFA-related protein|nr:VWA domain-containing protein [Anaerolineales bacterium]